MAPRGRNAEDFKVRRWLQIGAASAGLGAAMWGMSLVGAGVALADDAGSAGTSSSGASSSSASSSSASAGSGSGSGSASSASKGGAAKSAVSGPKKSAGSSAAGAKDATSAKDAKDAKGVKPTRKPVAAKPSDVGAPDDDAATATSPGTSATPASGSSATSKGAKGADDSGEVAEAPSAKPRSDSGQSEPEVRAESASLTTAPQAGTAAAPSQAAAQAATQTVPVAQAAAAGEDPWAVEHTVGASNPWQLNTSAQIAAFTAGVQSTIDALPLPPELRYALSGTLWTVRRGLFNLAPTVGGPVQVVGDGGPIAGNVGAVDPEGDVIVYGVVQGPSKGTVVVHADGSYTYTPGAGFDGVDSFVISATDVGLHVNLVDWFRAPATVGMLLNQNAVTFAFDFHDDANWTTDRQQALQRAAKRLASFVMVTQATTLNYNVTTINDSLSPLLAQAGSLLYESGPGFFRTIVGSKLQSGAPSLAGQPDGIVQWNWGKDWSFDGSVEPDEFDLEMVAMHELMHSFGFISALPAPSSPTSRTNWHVFTKYVTTRDGTPLVGADFVRDTDYDYALTGGDDSSGFDGVFFSGPNAMAAYGGRVPLFSPGSFAPGSSASHLNDVDFLSPVPALMNHATNPGPATHTLTAVELGILADIGYHVVRR
jgi:hypothetical protein